MNEIRQQNKMNMVVPNKVIIWGVDDYNVLGLYRQLGPYNLDITFLVFQGLRGCATVSKYCKNYYVASSLNDGKEYLISTFSEEKFKPIILCSNDLIAEFLDLYQNDFEKFFIIPKTGMAGNLKKYDDKNTMTVLASSLGFTIPKSIRCDSNTDIRNIEYPCLIKPAHQTEGKYNEFKYIICQNERQLYRTLKFVRKDSSFILQQYIPKESVALVYGCRMKNGEIVLAGILEKDRFCDNGDGSHGILSSIFPSYINIDLIRKIIVEVGFYGLFSIEFGVYKNNSYFFEVNWRNDGTSHLFFQAGANIPLAWIYDAVGLDYKSIPTSVNSHSVFIDELFDIQNIGRNGLTKELYVQQYKEANIFKYYDLDDMEPFLKMKKRKRKKLLLDSLVLKYRLYIVYLLDKLGIRRK